MSQDILMSTCGKKSNICRVARLLACEKIVPRGVQRRGAVWRVPPLPEAGLSFFFASPRFGVVVGVQAPAAWASGMKTEGRIEDTSWVFIWGALVVARWKLRSSC